MENEDWDLTALDWNAAPPEKEKKKKEEKRQPEKRIRPVAEEFSYKYLYRRAFSEKHPDKLRLSMFRCHAKIIAGRTPDFAFSVQTSANMDTNPRTEQGCIQISEESYMFFKNYLDGIISFL